MNIEKIKANKPEGAEQYSLNTDRYYRKIDGKTNCYFDGEWCPSIFHVDLISPNFIDLRETAPAWTPENNTLPFGKLTREQKLALMAAWVDGEPIGSNCIPFEQAFVGIVPTWNPSVTYNTLSGRDKFIVNSNGMSNSEIYDAIKSGKLNVD